MIMLNARRWSVIAGLFCLLLMGFAGATYAAVRFDVVQSPTEVINTGRSEVTGSVKLIVRGTGNVTGTSTGGSAQIAFLYSNPSMQIDNTESTGIRLFFSSGFIPAFTKTATSGVVGIVGVENIDVNGRCTGHISINLAPGATPVEGEFIVLDGVRGRIDASLGITPGVNLSVQLQSANDPSANSFTPDTVRVATSFDGITVRIAPADTLLLCFPTLGKAPPGETTYQIVVSEGFQRAFVDSDANNDNGTSNADRFTNDRVDSGGGGLLEQNQGSVNDAAPTASARATIGQPTNSTQLLIWFESIPASVSGITYEASVHHTAADSDFVLVSSSFTPSAGVSQAIYSYESSNQTGASDTIVESFTFAPTIILKPGATATGIILAAVSLAPTVGELTGLCPTNPPSSTAARPRFLLMYESDELSTNNPPSDVHKPYASIIRCNCYLLFTYVSTNASFNTGIAIANTTGDSEPFGDAGAPDQIGKIRFYFYDKTAAYVGSTETAADYTPGKSFVGLLDGLLPDGVASFEGYIIAKAEFQFCHGFAFIADRSFAAVAQGYLANVIPDPAIRWPNNVRTAADAGDSSNIVAGEGLNN